MKNQADNFPTGGKGSPIDGDIDLSKVLTVVLDNKLFVVCFTLLSAMLSVVYSLSLPNTYTASAIVAPAEQSSGGLGGLMQQYGGLASLAGFNLSGSAEGSKAQLGIQLMKSRSFVSDFINRHDILPELMAAVEFDENSGALLLHSDFFDAAEDRWVEGKRPSMQRAVKKFSASLSVLQDRQTGYVSISLEHRSPELAAQWVNKLVVDVNEVVKSQDVEQATKSINYLEEQATKTPLTELRTMFYELIQSQTETMMLAEARAEYVFKVIDPAIAPEFRSGPGSRALLCAAGTLFGCVLSVVLVLSRYLFTLRPLN